MFIPLSLVVTFPLFSLVSGHSKLKGGNCDFFSCREPQCRGGSCRFVDPRTTLRDGYCNGGACTVNGRPFPSRFAGKLTV